MDGFSERRERERAAVSCLIAIHGPSGSGKSVVADHLRTTYGFSHVSSGSLCRAITSSLFGHEERQALNSVSQAVRSIDKYLWIKATLRQTQNDRVVFDSVRYVEDAHYLRERGFHIWKIICPVDICISRLQARGQVFTLSDFSHDSEREIPNSLCAGTIDNGARPLANVLAEVDVLVRGAP